MICSAIRELLSAYLDQELDATDLRLVEEHLKECPACTAELAGLRRTVQLVQRLPRESVPADFAKRVAVALPAVGGTSGADLRGSRPESPSPGFGAPGVAPTAPLPFRRYLVPLVAAASILVAAGVALLVRQEELHPAAAPAGEVASRGAYDRPAPVTAQAPARNERAKQAGVPAARKGDDVESYAAPPPRPAASAAPEFENKAEAVRGLAQAPPASRPAPPGDLGAPPVFRAQAAPVPAEADALAAGAPAGPPAPPAAAPAPAAPESYAAEEKAAEGRADRARQGPDPFQPRLTKKAPAAPGGGAGARPPAEPALEPGRAGEGAAQAPADYAARDEAAAAPVVVLALHGGAPARQKAMLDELAWGPPGTREDGKDKGRAGADSKMAGQPQALKRSGENAAHGAKPAAGDEVEYLLSPAEAARFLERLAARGDLRVSVERKLLASAGRGEGDAAVRKAVDDLDRADRRKEALASAPKKRTMTSPTKPEPSAAGGAAPSEATAPASPAPDAAAKAPASRGYGNRSPDADASPPGAHAETEGAVQSQVAAESLVRIVVRLLPE